MGSELFLLILALSLNQPFRQAVIESLGYPVHLTQVNPMSIVFNAKTYTADSFQKDSIAFVGAAKTVSVKDDLKLQRTAPKPTVAYSGVGRTQAKLSRTLTLTGALTPSGDAIISCDVAVPVGFASADVDALLNDFGALVSSASFKLHVKSQQINF